MGDQRLRGIITPLIFYPRAQALQVTRLQEPQQCFLLLTPEMLGVRIVMAKQGFHFADLHTVVDPAFYLADPVDVGLVEQTMPTVRSVRFK